MSVDWSITRLILAGVLLAMAGYSVVAALRTHLPWARWRVWALLGCRLALLLALAAWALDVRLSFRRSSKQLDLVVVADRSATLSGAGQQSVEQWLARAKATGHATLATVELGSAGSAGKGLAEALEQARHAFRGVGEKRLIVVSDGRFTGPDPLAVAPRLKDDAIGFFAAPAEALGNEAVVADLIVPAAAWRAVPLPIQVQVRSTHPTPARLTLLVDGQVKETRDVQLPAGLSGVDFKTTFDADGVHRLDLRAEFSRDTLSWNNSASALLSVPLAPRVVLVSETPTASAALLAVLTSAGMQTRAVKPAELPGQFSADCIILDNVRAASLGEAQLAALESYVAGGGAMIFVGGERAFAAGGYAGTPLEPAFPVLLTPNKEQAPNALCIVLDNSWSMNEAVTSSVGKINLAKEIAIAAAEGLNRGSASSESTTVGDTLALVSFDSDYHDIIPPTQVVDLAPARYEISRIGAFGMTNILGGLNRGREILGKLDVANKHLLLVSDGKETETGTDYSRLLADLDRSKIALSTVAVGTSVDQKLLNTLSFAGKGRFYHAKSLAELPAIVLQEAKNLEEPLSVPVPLPIKALNEDPATAGLDVNALPPLGGYSRSRARPHAWTPLVIGRKNEPLLARMRYGRGQTLAFASTSSPQWAKAWITQKPGDYATFWRQATLSVLPPPHRLLEHRVDYAQGLPVFELGGDAEGLELSTVSQGQLVTAPADPKLRLSSADQDAILLTSRGKTLRAMAWSKTYGQAFDDAAKGVRTLQSLAQEAGGVFDPALDAPFAPARAIVPWHWSPATWLAAAVLLLVVELFLRRGPALAGLLGSRQRVVGSAVAVKAP